MAVPALGSGSRFDSLKATLAGRKGVRNAGALAASIGRKKYGAKRFAGLASAGRKKSLKSQMAGYAGRFRT